MKDQAKRFKPALISYVITRSWLNRMKFASGRIDSFGGATTVHRPIEESLGYVNRVFEDFVKYGGLTPQNVVGKRYVEFGPGDNVGVALRMIAMGCKDAICMDKFYSTHDLERERQMYLQLRELLSDEEKRRFDDAVSLKSKLIFNEEKIRYIYGKGAEDADEAVDPGSCDLVCSRGVLQGTNNEKAFNAINTILSPGGLSLHKIDLRDHGIFSGNGYHPLEFLTVSDLLYGMMIKGTDRPNRNHLNYYEEKMKQYEFTDVKLYRCGIILRDYYQEKEIIPHKLKLERGIDYGAEEEALIAEVRPRLRPQFSNLTDEQLLSAGLFLCFRKPEQK